MFLNMSQKRKLYHLTIADRVHVIQLVESIGKLECFVNKQPKNQKLITNYFSTVSHKQYIFNFCIAFMYKHKCIKFVITFLS